ncbi:MAG: cation:proton antiporter subunit C [Deltaproteobacteria bacterium]|nr:cation:proton antiporter subunit C [Deltaproteobacteria bacterium]
MSSLATNYTYFMTAALLAIGLYGMIGKKNLLKKLIGMNIFQTAIFLFFIHGAVKPGTTVPVLDSRIGMDAAAYINPLPHVLILTAIVVSVATTGVALALLITIYRRYGSLEETTILERMKQSS